MKNILKHVPLIIKDYWAKRYGSVIESESESENKIFYKENLVLAFAFYKSNKICISYFNDISAYNYCSEKEFISILKLRSFI